MTLVASFGALKHVIASDDLDVSASDRGAEHGGAGGAVAHSGGFPSSPHDARAHVRGIG
jgi:hypothetical protein